MLKKTLSLALVFVLAFSSLCFSVSVKAYDGVLRFNSDNTFKIVVFADCQDDDTPYQEMLDFMSLALDVEKPDLVVFTGDNVVVSSNSAFRTGAWKIMQPVHDRRIPFAYVFGNHDAEKVTKEYMHSVYTESDMCLTYDADPSLTGFGNCNIPVYSSDGSTDIAFNLWMIDSNMYPSSGSGYDNVHQDQLNWLVDTDNGITASQGHKVNSMVFQHIIVPEAYDLLVQSSSGSKTYNGKKYDLQLNSRASGYLGEFPCPPNTNSGEYSVMRDMGNVLGIVTGHDHSNSFVGHLDGLDLIQMPGMTFYSYGDSNARGYGVIELNESDTSTYSSHTVRYVDRWQSMLSSYEETNDRYYSYPQSSVYISDLAVGSNSKSATALSQLTNAGYTPIEFDLNKGAGGNYIYLGYKTTTNYNDALKDIRMYSDLSDIDDSTISLTINSVSCSYTRYGSDLNKESGGDYIYIYATKNLNAGPAITEINFSVSDTADLGKVRGTLISPDTPSDLNKNTTKHNNGVYLFTKTSASDVTENVASLREAIRGVEASEIQDLSVYKEPGRSEFVSAYGDSLSFVSDISAKRSTFRSGSDISQLERSLKNACASLTKAEISGSFIAAHGFTFASDNVDSYFNSPYVTAYASHNPDYPNADYVGTGCVITVDTPYGCNEYTAVIRGDINGDGIYDGTDAFYVRLISAGVLETSYFSAAQLLAADCNHDGRINDADAVLLEKAGLLLESVGQSLSSTGIGANSESISYLTFFDQSLEPVDPVKDITSDAYSHSGDNFFTMLWNLLVRLINYLRLHFSILK